VDLGEAKIAVFDWQPGRAPQPTGKLAKRPGITWVDVDDATPDVALAAIEPLGLKGFKSQYLWHQFSNVAPDDPHAAKALASFEPARAERLASARWPFLLQAEEPVFVEIGPGPEVDRSLATIRIGMLAGKGWLITYRMHPLDLRFGGYDLPTIRRERLAEAAAGFQRSDQTSVDVGTLMLEHLAKRSLRVAHEFRDAIGNRMLDLHRGTVQGSFDDAAAARVRRELFDLRWVLDAFERTTRRFLAAGDALTERWYEAAADREKARQVEAIYESSLAEAGEARRSLADALGWLAAEDSRRALERQAETQREMADLQQGTADLQELVGLLTVFVLVPTMVATLFGAMPSWWDDHQELRSVVLVAVMALAGIASWLLFQARIGRRGPVTYGSLGTPVYRLPYRFGIELNRELRAAGPE
jgi:hypothetical protein